MELNLDRVRRNVEQATTVDLLDRVTVYRAGMEPIALEMIEAELHRRGVTAAQIHDHAADREDSGLLRDGEVALPCHFCRRPAVVRGWGWHRLWGVLPLFPRRFNYCEEHRP